MSIIGRFTEVLGLTALAVQPALAQSSDSRAELLVDAAWLMENIDQPGVIVIHVARNAEGRVSDPTIPGAAVMELGQISYNVTNDVEPVRLDVPQDMSSVRTAFEEAGVSDGSRIVVVYDGERFPNAARTVWTLQLLGFNDGVSILNGGMDAWVAAGGTTSTERAESGPGTISRAVQMDRRVDAGWVLDNGEADGVALIDARRTESWDGRRPEIEGRAGHIPGAGSLPQVDLHDDNGMLKGADELRAIFARAGVTEGDGVVAYCHIGLWASSVVFAARTLGLDARLYDGSMTEWAADSELPLVTEPGGGH